MDNIPVLQTQRGLTVRYPATMAVEGSRAMFSHTHVVGINGYREDSVHYCLLLNPPPGGYMTAGEHPTIGAFDVVELLFSNFSDTRMPYSKGTPFDFDSQNAQDIDGFCILVKTNSIQEPMEAPSMKSSPSAKDIALSASKSTSAAYLSSKGYGLNITDEGDVVIIGANSSLTVSDKLSSDAPLDTNELRGNLSTSENFISKQMMIPDNIETWLAAHDPTINIVEIINTAAEVARWVLLAKQAMSLYEEFAEWNDR